MLGGSTSQGNTVAIPSSDCDVAPLIWQDIFLDDLVCGDLPLPSIDDSVLNCLLKSLGFLFVGFPLIGPDDPSGENHPFHLLAKTDLAE